jgi:hypothetical protein
MQQRPASGDYAPFYAGYVARVPAGDLVALLDTQIDETVALLAGLPGERAAHRYAPGKWSVREVAGHLADAERIMATRALRFARGDTTPLPGFEENAYVAAGDFEARPLSDLVDDLRTIRRATVALFRGLPDGAWARAGTANQARVTVLGLACIIAGHELHHREILQTRYGLGT